MIMRHPVRIELWAILRLAGPLIASQLAHLLMVLTDTLMMARLRPESFAGGGLGEAPHSLVSFFCIGVIASGGTQIGRVSCRESVWQYVLISVVAVSLKKKYS